MRDRAFSDVEPVDTEGKVIFIKLKPLAQQVIVITGASSGIGRETALLAASRGATVVVVARGQDALTDLVAQIEATGGRAMAIICDVADSIAVEDVAKRAVAAFDRIDCWVNNAGVAIASRLETLPEVDARRMFEVNFWGMVHGCIAALPHLSRGGGALINVGSLTSDVASPFMGMYSASKQAIKGYTDALRIELLIERRPVSVTLIKPAPIATPILQHQRNLLDHEATMPAPFYLPKDVAESILFAAEHSVRDLFVGGASRYGSIIAQILPRLADLGAASLGRRLFMTERPPMVRVDNLREVSAPAAVEGETHGHAARRSLYTALRVRPKRTAAGLGLVILASGGIAMNLLARNRRSPGGHKTLPRR